MDENPATHLVCPTALVDAPVDVVWSLLTQPAGWGSFYDLRVTQVTPPGPAAAGQIVRCEAGPRFLHLKIEMRLDEIDTAGHRLRMQVTFPFGLTVREDMNCIAVGERQCRVNYRCGFGFPNGWRGRLLRLVLRRQIEAGPRDSIARLKRAAEQPGLQPAAGSHRL
ncbi:MAG TPA: SRPBCC family protein [Rhizomicrobium sp.]